MDFRNRTFTDTRSRSWKHYGFQLFRSPTKMAGPSITVFRRPCLAREGRPRPAKNGKRRLAVVQPGNSQRVAGKGEVRRAVESFPPPRSPSPRRQRLHLRHPRIDQSGVCAFG